MLKYSLESEFSTDKNTSLLEVNDKPNTLIIMVENLPYILKYSSENGFLFNKKISQFGLPEGYSIDRKDITCNVNYLAFKFHFGDKGSVTSMKNNFLYCYNVIQNAVKLVVEAHLDDYYRQNLSGKYTVVTDKITRHLFADYGEPLHCVNMHTIKVAFNIMKNSMNDLEQAELWSTVWHNDKNEVMFSKKQGYRDLQILLYTGAVYLRRMQRYGIDI